jgi:hypothetical protein
MKDGGRIFPYQFEVRESIGPATYQRCIHESEGMTLRDYFAGQALISMLRDSWALGQGANNIAKHCYQYADAMLAEKEREE